MSKESAAASYQKNRARRLEAFRARYLRERDIVFARLGGACACCGESEPHFLTCDHMNNDGHVQRAADPSSYSRMYSWLIKNNFPDGFQLLCMNCNQGRHRNGGICPHQEGSTTRTQVRTAKRPEAPDPSQEGEDIVCSVSKDAAAHIRAVMASRTMANIKDKNSLGVSAGMIWGLKKTMFNSVDFGALTISTYAVAH